MKSFFGNNYRSSHHNEDVFMFFGLNKHILNGQTNEIIDEELKPGNIFFGILQYNVYFRTLDNRSNFLYVPTN